MTSCPPDAARPRAGYFSPGGGPVQKEPSAKRTIAFFDGQNLFHSAKEAFGYSYPNYDPLKLANTICREKG